MTYQTPAGRREAVEEVRKTLESADRIVLTTHINADGDGTGSQVALRSWLRSRGSEAWIVNPTPFPRAYEFLLEDTPGVVEAGSPEAQEVCAQADLGVVLDTAEVSRLGRVKPLFDPLPKVVIDHHPPGEQPIPGIRLLDSEACAAGELVYDLIHSAGGPWTEAVTLGLYVAILTDTGSFRFSNSTPGAHRIAANLIAEGVDPESTHRRVYGAHPLRALRLLRASLEHLEVDGAGEVAWMTVPRDICRRLDVQPDDLEGLVDYPRSVEGVEVGILFRETERGETKVSFRSNGRVDVNEVARQFDGGGHAKASGALVSGRLTEVRPKVVEAVRDAVRRTLGRRAGGGNPDGGDDVL